MRLLFLLSASCFYFVSLNCMGQFNYVDFPTSMQLYQRNEQNISTVPIIVNYDSNVPFTHFSLTVTDEDGVIVFYRKSAKVTSNSFNVNCDIFARLTEYSFSFSGIYASQIDSLIAKSVNGVLCGDITAFYGQSNSIGFDGIDSMTNDLKYQKYLRNADYEWSGAPVSTLKWNRATVPYAALGIFPLRLGYLLSQSFQVPQAMVSGAVGGATINQLNDRIVNDIYNQSTNYGRFIAKVIFALNEKKLKRIIWRQGEADANNLHAAQNYATSFTSLRSNLKQDIAQLEKIYVAQNDIISIDYIGNAEHAGLLRDNQRKLGELFSDVEVFATAGMPGYDGLHYNWSGHDALASQLVSMIADDENFEPRTENLYPPNVQEVFFNEAKDSITIMFKPNQVVSFLSQRVYISHTRQLVDYLLFDHSGASIIGVTADNNRLILSLAQPSLATKLTYLPTHLKDAFSNFYDGPVISNTNGIPALSFQDFPISAWLAPLTNLKIGVDNNHVQLTWDSYPVVDKIIRIEVQSENLATFQVLAEISSAASIYVDNLPSPSAFKDRKYRLTVFETNAKSPYSYISGNSCLENLSLQGILNSDLMAKSKTAATLKTTFEGNWQLSAGQYIVLIPGFETLGHTVFKAEIGGCN